MTTPLWDRGDSIDTSVENLRSNVAVRRDPNHSLLCVKKLRVDDGGSGCRVVLDGVSHRRPHAVYLNVT